MARNVMPAVFKASLNFSGSFNLTIATSKWGQMLATLAGQGRVEKTFIGMKYRLGGMKYRLELRQSRLKTRAEGEMQ